MNLSDRTLLRLIAVFKLLKAAALILTGIGLLKLVHRDIATTLQHWVAMLGLDPGRNFITEMIARATSIPYPKIRELGTVSFIYAGLFTTEGIGLWFLKHWAEWFTVIITSSLVPVEIYEIARRPTATRVIILLFNIGVVFYLVYRIRADRGFERNMGKPGRQELNS